MFIDVKKDQNLRPKAKALYAVLLSSCKKGMITTITDFSLKLILKCGISTVQSLLNELEHKSYIERALFYKGGITKRIIKILK